MSDYAVAKAIERLAKAVEATSLKRNRNENISFGKNRSVFLIEDDYDRIRWVTGTENGIELNKMASREDWAQIKRWCEENCKEPVSFFVGDYGDGTFYFFSRDDMMYFKLVWA